VKALAKYLLSVTVWPGELILAVSSNREGEMIQSTYPVNEVNRSRPELTILVKSKTYSSFSIQIRYIGDPVLRRSLSAALPHEKTTVPVTCQVVAVVGSYTINGQAF